jgi:hypothetical protein
VPKKNYVISYLESLLLKVSVDTYKRKSVRTFPVFFFNCLYHEQCAKSREEQLKITAGACQSSIKGQRKAETFFGLCDDNYNMKFGSDVSQELSNVFTKQKASIEMDLVGIGCEENDSEYRNVLQHEVTLEDIKNL